MSSGELREQAIAPLVSFVVGTDGATMTCHYCHTGSKVTAQDVPGQIVRFQDQHFGCDPSLRPLSPAAEQQPTGPALAGPQVPAQFAAQFAAVAHVVPIDHERGC